MTSTMASGSDYYPLLVSLDVDAMPVYAPFRATVDNKLKGNFALRGKAVLFKDFVYQDLASNVFNQ